MYVCMYELVCTYTIRVVQKIFFNYSCLITLISDISNKNNVCKILLN